MSEVNYPSVFLYHLDGGHIERSNISPTHRHEGKPSAFTILPLNDDSEVIECSSSITTRSEYVDNLTSWKKVIIQGERGRYLTCGTCLPHGGALAYYVDNLAENNQFELEHCPTTGTFSFKSYNGLHLHYNSLLGLVSFKTKEAREASWHVHPLGLEASNTEQILFVGVVNKEKEFIIQRTAEGVAHEWKVDLEIVLDRLIETLPFEAEGSSTLFQHPRTKHQWCVIRSNENSINIVVSSTNYPQVFASECVEELEDIYMQFNDKAKDEKLREYNIDKEQNYCKILAALMYDYDDQYACSSYAAANEKIRKTLENMQQNIHDIQDNIVTAEELKEKTDELLEFAATFKKQSSELKHVMSRKAAILGAGMVGAASGAIVGFFAGGPGAAAFLGAEIAEIGFGAAAGIALGTGGAAMMSHISRFWKRTFIRNAFV